MKNSYKVYIDSANWLCEPNVLGFSIIERYIKENGHYITTEPSDADFIVINSCGFTKDHEHKSITLFNKLFSKKETKAKVIMFGCLIKINKKLVDSLDLIPIDFDEGEKFDKIFYNNIKFKNIKPYCDTKKLENIYTNKTDIKFTGIAPILLSRMFLPFSKKLKINYQKIVDDLIARNKILVEIGKGCASNCNYCVIKKTKGKIQSRKINDIASDIGKLYHPSKQVFFVADDCSCYGMDIGKNLNDLLHEIKKKFPDSLINLDNINPCWLEKYPDEYLKMFSEFNISYATIPIQSGSNKIIKEMNREYDIEKIKNLVIKIKKISPKTAIYTHFIICYPNEKFIDYLKSLYYSMFFDLSLLFVYSEPKDSSHSDVFDYKSIFIKTYRSIFFMFIHNFVTLYKLMNYQNIKT